MRKLKPHEVTKCIRAATWEDLQRLADALPGWVFRGQEELKWRLQPTLERLDKSVFARHSYIDIEGHVVSQFKRVSPIYLDSLPMHKDIIGWLSLIQSYGGPTRLLDFTRSLYVGAFFALEKASRSEHRVIWAVNDRVIRGALTQVLRTTDNKALLCANEIEGGELIHTTLGASFTGPAACAGTPYFLNERLVAQQGLFLFSLNMELTLEENLYGMFGVDASEVYRDNLVAWFTNPLSAKLLRRLQRTPIIKIVVPSEERVRILRDLRRMNISHASLFPGLDGYARGLNHEFLGLQQELRVGDDSSEDQNSPEACDEE